MQLCIFREVNLAHAAFAEQRKNPVMAYRLIRLEFIAFHQHLGRCLIGRRIHKVTCLFMRLNQRLDRLAQRGIAVARLLKMGRTLIWRQRYRRVKYLFEIFPMWVGHIKSLRQAYAAQQVGVAWVRAQIIEVQDFFQVRQPVGVLDVSFLQSLEGLILFTKERVKVGNRDIIPLPLRSCFELLK